MRYPPGSPKNAPPHPVMPIPEEATVWCAGRSLRHADVDALPRPVVAVNSAVWRKPEIVDVWAHIDDVNRFVRETPDELLGRPLWLWISETFLEHTRSVRKGQVHWQIEPLYQDRSRMALATRTGWKVPWPMPTMFAALGKLILGGCKRIHLVGADLEGRMADYYKRSDRGFKVKYDERWANERELLERTCAWAEALGGEVIRHDANG